MTIASDWVAELANLLWSISIWDAERRGVRRAMTAIV